MTTELLLAFLIYAFVSAITPGPNNMMVMASGLNYGFKQTLPHIAGITVGFTLMVFLAGLGLMSLLESVPFLYQTLHVVCAVYLLYLAWKIATASPLGHNKTTTKKPFSFLQAMAFQWVNPKALVMAMAAITTYVPEVPGSAFLLNVTIVAVLYGLVSFPCGTIWTLFGNSLRYFLSDPLHYKIFNISMAVALILSLYPLWMELIHILVGSIKD